MSNEEAITVRMNIMKMHTQKEGYRPGEKWGVFFAKPTPEAIEKMHKDSPSFAKAYPDASKLIKFVGTFPKGLDSGQQAEISFVPDEEAKGGMVERKVASLQPIGFRSKAATVKYIKSTQMMQAQTEADNMSASEENALLDSIYNVLKAKKHDSSLITEEDFKDKDCLTTEQAKDLVSELLQTFGKPTEPSGISGWLQGLGYSESLSSNVSDTLERRGISLDNVRANPYLLANENLLTFESIDSKWKETFRFDPQSEDRMMAVMCAATTQGTRFSSDTLLDEYCILRSAKELAGLGSATRNEQFLKDMLAKSIKEGFLGKTKFKRQGDDYEKNWYQSYRMKEMERSIANKLLQLNKNGSVNKDDAVLDIDSKADASQSAAIRSLVNGKEGVGVLTGGPGYGKTWTVKSVVDNARKIAGDDYKVVCLTPTGISAESLEKATGVKACTIHKALGYSKDGTWTKGDHDKLVGDLFCIDESFMKDISLTHHLLQAIPDHARIIFIGDKDQFAPIGSGQPAIDIMNAGHFATCVLETNHRSGAGSGISEIVKGITEGKVPHNDLDDVHIHDTTAMTEEESVRALMLTVMRLAVELDDAERDSQVLLPMVKGAMGTHALNPLLRRAYRPEMGTVTIDVNSNNIPAAHIKTYPSRGLSSEILLEGDKVMQTANDTDTDTRNGQLGIVKSVLSNGSMQVKMDDGREILFSSKKAKLFSLGYAISGTKAQSMGVKHVVLGLSSEHHEPMLRTGRNMLYTCISRASQSCTIVGDSAALETATASPAPVRLSMLRPLFNWTHSKNMPINTQVKSYTAEMSESDEQSILTDKEATAKARMALEDEYNSAMEGDSEEW